MSETEPQELYDTIIIGGGPAGLSAGMYAARQGLSTAIIAGSVGGQAQWAHKVENFIGWQIISGPELVERFREHAARFGVDCFEGKLVNAIVPGDKDTFDVFTREGLQLKGKTVLIATGKSPNRLAIPGENELVGKGVSYCATCDAPFFVGRPVAVVGPGESAADAALQLATLGAGPITLVNPRALIAPERVLERLESTEEISVITGAEPVRIEGAEKVARLVIADADSGEERGIDVDAVFIEMGAIKADEFAMGLVEVNDKGEIAIDKSGATSTWGIYAAGDVTDEYGKQIITAAGQGARAAMAIARDLKRR
jgi:alkyl hydroperoxide reductase subunit F